MEPLFTERSPPIFKASICAFSKVVDSSFASLASAAISSANCSAFKKETGSFTMSLAQKTAVVISNNSPIALSPKESSTSKFLSLYSFFSLSLKYFKN